MIPKIIHYCWFGGNPLPKLAKKCIKSWKKYCPEYKIVRWDESNFDILSAPLYVRQAYDEQKWAFVSDYARLQIVYEHGGIYLDTDVELLKPVDSLLNYGAYFGFEDGAFVNTGLGFGAEKGNDILCRMMEDYQNIPFVLNDGTFDETTCPRRNTAALIERGLKQDDTMQLLPERILVLPKEFLCPAGFWNHIDLITTNSISTHWFSASWCSEDYQKQRWKRLHKMKFNRMKDNIRLAPKRLVRKIIGEKNVQMIKRKLERKNDS